MCVIVSRLHYLLIWSVYYDVLGTLILPIKRWDVIFFYIWVKNRRQEWPKCRLSPAAGCYFEPCNEWLDEWSHGNSFVQSQVVAYMKYKVDTIELSTWSSVNFILCMKLFKCHQKHGIVRRKWRCGRISPSFSRCILFS